MLKKKKLSKTTSPYQSKSQKFKTLDDFEPEDKSYLESTIREIYYDERVDKLSSDDYL